MSKNQIAVWVNLLAGFEPTSWWLTATRSTTELQKKKVFILSYTDSNLKLSNIIH